MGGAPLRLGPFIGGLNTVSDPTAVADAELVACSNMELDQNGSLVSRPPVKEQAGHVSFTERIICLTEAVFGNDRYIIGSNTNGVFYLLNDAWTLITDTVQCYVAIQYADKVYLVPEPGAANPGGKWDPVGGFTAVAAIPQGMAAVIHKERLFVVPGLNSVTNSSRLKFSNPSNFDVWDAANFIDIRPGDGSNLIDITIYQDNLLLFKNNSTHVLSYDIRPADAVLRDISKTIGVGTQFSVVNYENQVYILHNGWIYEIINYDFNRINSKVVFVIDGTTPSTFAAESTFLSLLEDRLICRVLNRVYVYGLRTRTWSEWSSSASKLHYFGPVQTLRLSTGYKYYAGSCVLAYTTTLQFYNTQSAAVSESIITPPTAVAVSAAATPDYLRATDADAADIAIGDTVRLYTSGSALKESKLFTVTAKVSAAGFTNISFTPDASVVTEIGDIMKVISVINCRIRTKNFDMAASHLFKRLWWWGADIVTNNEVLGRANPIIASFDVTWAMLSVYGWDQLNTWEQPLTAPTAVETTTATGTGIARRMVKFLKGLRYRQINFELELKTDGSTLDGPVRVFSMTILTETKQVVPKAVN